MEKPQYKKALVIGRFQPFHNGHLYLLKKTLDKANKIIIGIGSSNVTNIDNPFNFDERKKMIKEVILNKRIGNRIISVVDIPDVPDDDDWYKIVLKKTGKFDVVLGNNDWVNGILRKHGHKIIKIPYFKRYVNEGVKVRAKLKVGDSIVGEVPEYLIKNITKGFGG